MGTDNHDLLFGVPALQLPQVPLATTMPAAIPEIPFAKRRDQRGVAKVAVFAYRRDTGEPVWQSGIVDQQEHGQRHLGARRRAVSAGHDLRRARQFAGKRLVGEDEVEDEARTCAWRASTTRRCSRGCAAGEAPVPAPDAGVQQASAIEPALPAAPLADEPPIGPPPRPIAEAPRP